jgi:hypothetical protein
MPAKEITDTPVGPSVAAGAPDRAPKLTVIRSHVAEGSHRISEIEDASPTSSPRAAIRPLSPKGRSPARQISLLGARDVVVATEVVVVAIASDEPGVHADRIRPNPAMAVHQRMMRPYPAEGTIPALDKWSGKPDNSTMPKSNTDTATREQAVREGYRTFLIVWFGQVISLVGSGLTWFGISIWVFLESGSVTQLAIILLASQLPRILLSPIAGTFVDRWDRRWAMILSDAGAGAATLAMVALYLSGHLTIPALALIGAFSGAFQAFQFPAYQAATTLLVPKERYSQASGMVQMAEAISNLIAPALGGIMIAHLPARRVQRVPARCGTRRYSDSPISSNARDFSAS